MTKINESSSESYLRGKDLLEAGDYASALELLKSISLETPHFKTYESIGECLLALERPFEAILYLSAAAGLGNKQFRSYFLLAQALMKINDDVGATRILEQAISLNPKYKAARDLLTAIRKGRPS